MKRDLKNPLAPTFPKKNGGGDDPKKVAQAYLADPKVQVAGYRKVKQPDGTIALVGKGTAESRKENYKGSIFPTEKDFKDFLKAKEKAKKNR